MKRKAFEEKTLTLFFTRGVSLNDWVEKGIFYREKIIYEEHLKNNTISRVNWVTYGSNDRTISLKLKKQKNLHQKIYVYQKPKIFRLLGNMAYSLIIPIYLSKVIRQSDILKTNQMDGSWSALISKILYKKILFLRTGYIFSKTYDLLKGNKRIISFLIKGLENISYTYCTIGEASSREGKRLICNGYKVNSKKITVLYNYINTNQFKNLNYKNKLLNRLLFIGRLEEEKNIHNLITALQDLNIQLDIYGEGSLKHSLLKHAKYKNVKINFLGVVENRKLPEVLNNYKYYIIPSRFENMPKTLLEAMACGLICIGTNVMGINEVIKDNYNGFLSGDTSSETIRKTILRAIENDNQKIRENAVKTIQNSFSLDSVVKKEEKLIQRYLVTNK